MELELGLKITKTRDDLITTTNFRMAKDSSGPFFITKETESKFILTAHLKGFGREHIGITINDDGTQIAIRWEKPVQEMVMSGWIMHKKDVELRGFVRVFRIPEGVVLDRIKAKFNEQESVLTILMPKLVKGIRGVGIEEVKEEGVVKRGRNESARTTNEVDKSSGKVEESGQTIQKKADKERFKKETSAHKAQEKKIVGDRIRDKIKEPKINNRQGLRTTRSEVGESSKKGDIIGTTKKGEEGLKMAKNGGSDLVDNVKAHEGRSEIPQVITDRQSREEKDKESEQNKEKTSRAQKAEDDTISFGELEGSDTKGGIKKGENEILEDLEDTVGSQISQLDHDHPAADHHNGEEARDRKENPEEEDEFEEEEPKGGKEHHGQEVEDNEHDSPHEEENKDRSGQVPKKIKLCTPCVIVGSSLLVSLVVFAIHWIRYKKRDAR